MDAALRHHIRTEIDRRRRGISSPPKSIRKIEPYLFPSSILCRVLREHAESQGWGENQHMINDHVAKLTGYSTRRIGIMLTEQKNVSFDVMDYIITKVWVHLWWKDDELNAIYNSVPLEYDNDETRARSLLAYVPEPRKCSECGETWLPNRRQDKTCGPVCRNARHLRIMRERRAVLRISGMVTS